MEEFETLSSTSADKKKVGSGLEVSLLRDYVEELEKKQLKLVEIANETQKENEQRAKDQTDIYYYLNKKLDENYDTIQRLEEQILREQAEREVSEKDYEKTIEKLQQKIQADEAKANSKISDLTEKLEAVNEFILKKSEIEASLQETRAAVDAEKAENDRLKAEMEKRLIQEKRKLRQEFLIELEGVKRLHKTEIDGKLSTRTKRTKIKNAILKQELDYQVPGLTL
jgi:hypothetical protein